MIDETRKKLIEFKSKFGLRGDWHEPDEQEIDARVTGLHLDNAFGDSGHCDELVVVLYHKGQEELKVNLATLLALASE